MEDTHHPIVKIDHKPGELKNRKMMTTFSTIKAKNRINTGHRKVSKYK